MHRNILSLFKRFGRIVFQTRTSSSCQTLCGIVRTPHFMTPVKSTYEILANKVLNRSVDKTWIEWAYQMLLAGFDNESLIILAGETAPYNEFELRELTSKIFDELHLDYSDTEKVIKNYAFYLIDKAIAGEMESIQVLNILKEICIELDLADYLYHFYSLYFAKSDLLESENQWYIEGVDRSNIDSTIADYFVKWKIENKTTTA